MQLLAVCFLCRVERYRQFQVDALVVALLSGDAWLLAFLARERRVGLVGWLQCVHLPLETRISHLVVRTVSL